MLSQPVAGVDEARFEPAAMRLQRAARRSRGRSGGGRIAVRRARRSGGWRYRRGRARSRSPRCVFRGSVFRPGSSCRFAAAESSVRRGGENWRGSLDGPGKGRQLRRAAPWHSSHWSASKRGGDAAGTTEHGTNGEGRPAMKFRPLARPRAGPPRRGGRAILRRHYHSRHGEGEAEPGRDPGDSAPAPATTAANWLRSM